VELHDVLHLRRTIPRDRENDLPKIDDTLGTPRDTFLVQLENDPNDDGGQVAPDSLHRSDSTRPLDRADGKPRTGSVASGNSGPTAKKNGPD
jgi:hypothetical protein